jgi:hypothetical protein
LILNVLNSETSKIGTAGADVQEAHAVQTRRERRFNSGNSGFASASAVLPPARRQRTGVEPTRMALLAFGLTNVVDRTFIKYFLFAKSDIDKVGAF